MISPAVIAFSASVFVFTVLLFFVSAERRKRSRYVAASLRGWLDIKVDIISKSVLANWEHFIKFILQLNWYYSIHSVLRTWLQFIVKFYSYFENLFENNRVKTRQLRAEKRELNTLSHLSKMAEHKKDTALTSAQKRKLRHKKLEEKH